tara:strand:+ start:1352 stop:1576 length:225 start_codon:yes stop_codon:yes gene_type:complete
MKSYDDDVFAEGIQYSVGTNDGVSFRKIVFKGKKNNSGKQVLVFEMNESNNELIINPSYMSWALEEKGDEKWAD